ncbi:FAD binding domain-containing protein [Mycena sp. CBHHK59/15]|nr:FAD binding domain-containing protein [Mycena sp. CBHHK59/15]
MRGIGCGCEYAPVGNIKLTITNQPIHNSCLTMPELPPSYTDVLVVGAGPGGLMTAQALARLGVKVKIVDRRAPGEAYGYADGLMPRTLEVWKSYGMLEKIATKGNGMHVMVGYEQNPNGEGLIRTTPNINVIVPTRYPYEYTLATETLEGTLRENMEEAGTKITYCAAPISIDCPGSDGEDSLVKVVLQHGLKNAGGTYFSPGKDISESSNTEVVHAKYVIGADGAHSWVRRHLKIPMEGDQTDSFWGVTDVVVNTDLPDYRTKCVIQSKAGPMIIIPREGEIIRIYVGLSPQEAVRTADGRLDPSLPTERVRSLVLGRIQESVRPYKMEFTEVIWCTVFPVSQLVASKYRVLDKVFIVGDACHTHSPKAGQGANASMGDGHNLAWKLALVLRGWAKPSLLDTYQDERRKYAQDLIAFDKKLSDNLANGTAIGFQDLIHESNLFTSGVGLQYKAALTKLDLPSGATNLTAGFRLPPSPLLRLSDWCPIELQDLAPSDGLFKIFIFPGDILVPAEKSRLDEFGATLSNSIVSSLSERIRVYTVLRSSKTQAIWSDVPQIARDWKNVFISEGGHIYSQFGISADGVAILVRPDGYISILTTLKRAAGEIASFFEEF